MRVRPAALTAPARVRPAALTRARRVALEFSGLRNAGPLVGGSLGIFDDGQAHVITTAQLLAMVYDPDGDEMLLLGLTVTSVLDADGEAIAFEYATLADNGNGTWTITLADNWRGVVTMTLTATDGEFEVSGTVTADVEHVLYRHSGDTTVGLICGYSAMAVEPNPSGGNWVRTVSNGAGEMMLRLNAPIGVSAGDRVRISWNVIADTDTQLSMFLGTTPGYSSINAARPYGAQYVDYNVPLTGVTGVLPYFYVNGVAAGKEIYFDNIAIYRLNAAPIVAGSLDLPEAAETYTAIWSESLFLAPFIDHDIDDSLSVQSVTVSKGALVDIGGDREYTPALGDAGDVTVTVVVTDGVATATYSEIIQVQTKDYRDAEIAWEAGTEWDLDPTNPYHPSVETGSTFGYFTYADLGANLLRWWNPFDPKRFTLSGSNVAAYRDMVADSQVSQATATLQPTRVTGASGINGRPGVSFNGGNTLGKLGSTGLPTGNGKRNAYFIGEATTTGQIGTWISQGNNSTPVARVQSRTMPAGSPYFGGWGTDMPATSPQATTTDPMSAGFTYAGGTLGLVRLYKNGVVIGSGNKTVSADTDRFDMGSTNGIERIIGKEGDVVYTNGNETADEALKVWAAMHWRYGMQNILPESNPYKYNRPRSPIIALGTEEGLALGTEDGQVIGV